MARLNARTLSIMSGLLLSTALPGCAHQVEVEIPKPVPVAIAIKDTPPADLTRCADRPAGMPEDTALLAQIPTRARAGIIRLAKAFAVNAAQLDRLINWTAPGSCPASKGK